MEMKKGQKYHGTIINGTKVSLVKFWFKNIPLMKFNKKNILMKFNKKNIFLFDENDVIYAM